MTKKNKAQRQRQPRTPQQATAPEVVHASIDVNSLFAEACATTDPAASVKLAARSFLIDSKLPQNALRNLAACDLLLQNMEACENDLAVRPDLLVVQAGICFFSMQSSMAIRSLGDAIQAQKALDRNDKVKLAAILSLRSSFHALLQNHREMNVDLKASLDLNPACPKTLSNQCCLFFGNKAFDQVIDVGQKLYHLNPKGSQNHAGVFAMVTLALLERNSIDAAKFWLDLANKFKREFPTGDERFLPSATEKYNLLNQRRGPKEFDTFTARHADLRGPSTSGAVSMMDRLADQLHQRMVLGDAPAVPRNFDAAACVVDPSLADTSVPFLPEDGDQTPYKSHLAQILRSDWAEGMDFDPPDGCPLLHKKCFMGDIKWLKENAEWSMLEWRASKMRFTPLMLTIQGARQIAQLASWMDHAACAKWLIKKGAQLNARCVIGNTAVFYATGHLSNLVTLKIGKILLEAGASAKIQNRFGCTALMEPVMGGAQESVELLVQYGCDPHVADYEETKPWNIARTRPSIFQVLTRVETTRQRDTAASTPARGCSCCGVPESDSVSLKICLGCLTAAYCTTKCQTEDWKKGGHKVECKKANIVTVTLNVENAQIMPFDARKAAQMKATAGKSERVRTVKIQMASERLPMLVYDKERSFTKTILPTEPEFGVIATLIRERGVLGQKAYFKALVPEGAEKMTVLVTDVLTPGDW
ncbi:Ankyrin repeat domain-containing protein 39 [Podochytrium sp. JEL0797]|nr:Ankyrin repeat domain-containing protein 39 [Podochytrium sp. JEL0797]